MLEKIKPYLDDLKKEYETYAKKKKWFRKNKDILTAFEKDPDMLNKVRDMIKIYDTSHIFLKLWIRISIFWSIPHYKNILQYYDLNVLLQKIYSEDFGEEDKIRFLEEMITLLDRFDAKIKEKILFSMQQALLKAHPDSEKEVDTKACAVSTVDEEHALSLSHETSVEIQNVWSHHAKVVKNMMHLLKVMRATDWGKLVREDEVAAYARYYDLIAQFEAALKECDPLRIHLCETYIPLDMKTNVYREVEDTYHKYAAYKESIKVHVEKNGLASLHASIPAEAQSIIDLLEALHITLEAHMQNCDAHLAMLHTYLPQQKREVDLLVSEVGEQSQAISVLQQEGIKKEESLLSLSKEMEEHSVRLDALRRERNRQSLVLHKQSEDMRQFDEKVRLLIIEQMKEWIGGSGGKGGQQMTRNQDAQMQASPKMTFFQT